MNPLTILYDDRWNLSNDFVVASPSSEMAFPVNLLYSWLFVGIVVFVSQIPFEMGIFALLMDYLYIIHMNYKIKSFMINRTHS